MATKNKTTVENSDTVEPVEVEFNSMAGAHLLKPAKRLMPHEILRLQNAVSRISEAGFNAETVADFLELIDQRFTVDFNAWAEFCINEASQEDVLNLVMAYVGEVGKEKLS